MIANPCTANQRERKAFCLLRVHSRPFAVFYFSLADPVAALLESWLFRRQALRETILSERIDSIRREKHAELIADLQERTGLTLSRLELGKINFLKDTVLIEVFYQPHAQERTSTAGIDVTLVSREY